MMAMVSLFMVFKLRQISCYVCVIMYNFTHLEVCIMHKSILHVTVVDVSEDLQPSFVGFWNGEGKREKNSSWWGVKRNKRGCVNSRS